MKSRSKSKFPNYLVGAATIGMGAFGSLAVAQVAAPEAVETAQLPTDAFSIGGLRAGEQALPETLWSGSSPQTVDFLLSHLPTRPATPSLGTAMRRVLLSPGDKPAGADASLGGKKLLALTRAGFVDEAGGISSLATSGRNDVFFSEAVVQANLLSGDVAGACRRSANLASGREALFWVKLRALCYASAGELDAFDLTVNLLRERGAFSPTDEAYLMAALAGSTGRTPAGLLPPAETALHLAASRLAGVSLSPASLKSADGGVVVGLARDSDADTALRIGAAQQAIAMGLMDAGSLGPILAGVEFDVAAIAGASDAAASNLSDPLVDALLYQAIGAMDAPEFVRDKASRISQALALADSFHRAYALSVLYADDLETLEGIIVSPEEAANFAIARMAVGDSIGAARWLSAMIGANESVAALPETEGLAFIDRVNLLALLDPQTAAHIAREAGVAIISDSDNAGAADNGYADPAVTARILTAAFEAIGNESIGQAGLVALAASAGRSNSGGAVEAVMVGEGLAAAGMPELRRRHAFERAWAARYSSSAPVVEEASNAPTSTGVIEATLASSTAEEDGITPRLKPRPGE